MILTFLEICFVLFLLYIITQLFLPAVFPKTFAMNWLFKKQPKAQPKVTGDAEENIEEKIDELHSRKSRLNAEVDEVVTKTSQTVADAKAVNKRATELKK